MQETIRCKRQLDARDVVSCFYLYQTNGIESLFEVLCGSNFEAYEVEKYHGLGV